MDMSGEYRIPAPRETVWEALNDPDILRECIPGCESLEMTSPTEMTAAVTSKIGPVKAKFKGAVTLENINAPESYTIAGEGKGGVAGFAKGSADVHLAEDGAETVLTYTAKAQVGGKLAQLGSRLIDSTAKKMADEFFGKFTEKVGGTSQGASASADDLDAGVVEEAKSISLDHAAEDAVKAVSEAEHAVEERLHQAEENLEAAAVKGRFGGPMVWGLIALGAVIVVLALLN
ncbi:hypothetical protein JM93_03954 [Roseibium hamelinense]|uniref:Carbon monoxide dehydrogenase subunit G n=1 Tax=Roseibium hamelinense TaxID=150831 RepID=A0A562SJ23_9HYPH|nr:carbon monoxide dehydrogenase subunit G [Roseibium hamelinense]MTI43965.1 carbon monoxide dehydrogenase [Roseibium hamelinense]TWI80740.1 hypothetical protein JM93_03954 [Roseibium hamelinense]